MACHRCVELSSTDRSDWQLFWRWNQCQRCISVVKDTVTWTRHHTTIVVFMHTRGGYSWWQRWRRRCRKTKLLLLQLSGLGVADKLRLLQIWFWTALRCWQLPSVNNSTQSTWQSVQSLIGNTTTLWKFRIISCKLSVPHSKRWCEPHLQVKSRSQFASTLDCLF